MGFETYPRRHEFGWRFRDEFGNVLAVSPNAFADRDQAKQDAAGMVLAARAATYGQRDAEAIAADIADVDE